MNTPSDLRLALAGRLAVRLQHFRAVEAIAAIGSAARGYADVYSDLELLVIWDEPPDAALREAVRRHLDAQFRFPPIEPAHDHSLRIEGMAVDLWHTTQAAEDALIDTVLRDFSLDLVANNRLEIMASCVPLHGAALLERYKQRAAMYPEPVALGFLETYTRAFHLRNLQLAARRDNPTVYLRLLSEAQCSLFLVLLALNRAYFPTFKWIYPTLERMPLVPANIGQRLREMLTAPPLRAVEQLRAALIETLDLVEASYPQLDTAFARYGVAEAPPASDAPGAALE